MKPSEISGNPKGFDKWQADGIQREGGGGGGGGGGMLGGCSNDASMQLALTLHRSYLVWISATVVAVGYALLVYSYS